MKTERLNCEGANATAAIARAAQIVQAGGTVAFPTETVYGLGANALDQQAVAEIFIAKERPQWDPLIVHIASADQIDSVAHISDEFSGSFKALAAAFWPGPLTMLLPRSAAIPDDVTAGRPLVAVRVPSHPVAAALLRSAALPLAAPSANRFGRPSPTTAAHVLADLDGRIGAVLDGGQTTIGVESTVFDLAARIIYRPGAVSSAMISRTIGQQVLATVPETPTSGAAPESLASPGMGMRHYAPSAQLVLVSGQQELLTEVATHPASEVGVMLPDGWNSGAAVAFRWGPWNDPAVLARLLYFGFRFLEDRGVKVIVCPVPSAEGPLADAVRERIAKAARPA